MKNWRFVHGRTIETATVPVVHSIRTYLRAPAMLVVPVVHSIRTYLRAPAMLVVPVVHSIRTYRHVGGAGGALYQDLPPCWWCRWCTLSGRTSMLVVPVVPSIRTYLRAPAMLVVPVVHSIRTYRHVGGAGGALYQDLPPCCWCRWCTLLGLTSGPPPCWWCRWCTLSGLTAMLVVPVVHSIRTYRHVGGAGGALYQDLPPCWWCRWCTLSGLTSGPPPCWWCRWCILSGRGPLADSQGGCTGLT